MLNKSGSAWLLGDCSSGNDSENTLCHQIVTYGKEISRTTIYKSITHFINKKFSCWYGSLVSSYKEAFVTVYTENRQKSPGAFLYEWNR
jgi:hypothetical protein